jgi:hypothetical protein
MVTGLSHMEWFRRADGSIAISEVGARPPGAQFTTLLSFAHDVDFYRAWASSWCSSASRRRRATGRSARSTCRGQGGQRVERVTGVDAVKRELGELVVQARIPRPDNRSPRATRARAS